MNSSSDESDPAPPKKKVREIEDSPSTSSDSSPVIGQPFKLKPKLRSSLKNRISSNGSSENDSPIKSWSLGELRRLSSSSDSGSSSSSQLFRPNMRPRRLPSWSDSNESESFPSQRYHLFECLPSSTSQNSFTVEDFSQMLFSSDNIPKSKTSPNVNTDTDSSDEQLEKCPICLVSFRKQKIGNPEVCDHSFCLECILEWSKNMNTCPVDRQKYKIILVREGFNGEIISQVPVGEPIPVPEIPFDDDSTNCEICGAPDNEDRMLLCDGCDLGFHLYCLNPPLSSVPVGQWYCINCDSIYSDENQFLEILIDHTERGSRRTRNATMRLIPRTRQNERVRRQIVRNRNRSLSTNAKGIVSNSSVIKNRRSSRRRINKAVHRVKGTMKSCEKKIEKQIGKKSVENRNINARNLVLCVSKCNSKNYEEGSAFNNICRLRNQAGIPTLNLFAQDSELDYFSEDLCETGSQLLTRRVPNQSDILTSRRIARRKSVLNFPNNVQSSLNLLDSILYSQELLNAKNAHYSIDINGKFRVQTKETKKDFYIDVRKQETPAKQTPYGSNRHNYYNNKNSYNYNRRQSSYPSNNENYYSIDANQYSGVSQRSGNGQEDNDYPQDYTHRTLCNYSDNNTPEKRDKRDNSRNPITESEIDIYSDIENLASKPEESELKPPPTPPEFPNELMGVDDDSESDMVIDEKNQDVTDDSVVTSTVGFMHFPFPPPSFPPPLSLPPIPPSLNFPTENSFPDDLNSKRSSNNEFHNSLRDTMDSTLCESTANNSLLCTKYDENQVHSSAEPQPGSVQSSQQKLIFYDDDDSEENSADICPNAKIFTKETPAKDIDEDSNDGCPNFSIYSKESKNVALHTDISLPSIGNTVNQDFQSREVHSSSEISVENHFPKEVFDTNDVYNPEEETELSDDQMYISKEITTHSDETVEIVQDETSSTIKVSDANIIKPNISENKCDDNQKIEEIELTGMKNNFENTENLMNVQHDVDLSLETNVRTESQSEGDNRGLNYEESISNFKDSFDENCSEEPQVSPIEKKQKKGDFLENEEINTILLLKPPSEEKILQECETHKGLYSDSEDESVVRKTEKSDINLAISDINDMTEDISEEERSYTPCLDEKRRQGLEGLDTEMISDEDRSEFDESHELKNADDCDALEINAKEFELDFTKAEDYEEGEIIDKNKDKIAEKPTTESESFNEKKEKEEHDDKLKKNNENNKKNKKKPKDKSEQNKYKEDDVSKGSFKKLSKSNKERNYRDKDKDSSLTKLKDKEKKTSESEKKKEKRKELERYNVRALIAEKPRPLVVKDRFGRDILQSESRSRSRSYTPPLRSACSPRSRHSIPRQKSLSKTRTFDNHAIRSPSRSRRSPSRRDPESRESRKRQRSRNYRSHSRSLKKRSSSKNKKRKRSSTRYKRKSRERAERRKKRRVRSRSRHRSRSNERRTSEWEISQWSPPSMSAAEEIGHNLSPSWTPPRTMDSNVQVLRGENLTVTLNNTTNRRKEKRKTDKRNKENVENRRRRLLERETTPPPSKEVFASGDNILVSVSFNNENEVRDVTTKERKKVDQTKKKRDRRRRNRQDLSGVKPVAIIDLVRSPFREITSPKAVIVLTDSDNEPGDRNEHGVQQSICDSSQQVASPERDINYSTGPKTPPEPQIKFTLTSKTSQIRAITNPLHEPEDLETTDIHEELESRLNENVHNGPSTPPEPPNSPPSSPDVYDPFEPTKSRSPTPELSDTLKTSNINESIPESRIDSLTGLDLEKSINPSSEMNKSMTPPLLDIQPADSQTSNLLTPESNQLKSPDRVGGNLNQSSQSSSTSKPVAQQMTFSSVSCALITSTPITSNASLSRINILNSTIIPPPASSVPPRIVQPNHNKSSPVKISPIKATQKVTAMRTISSKTGKSNNKKRSYNNNSSDEIVIDFDSPYSPGSSDYEDLFEPPSEIVTKPVIKSKTKSPSKHLSTFDHLFGSPNYKPSIKSKVDKSKMGKKTVALSRTKTIGVKLDEDNLKILDELPNSAVEMLVKDKFLKKLNRLERVVEEVKHVLKPHYNKKRITKEEYKDIMRKSVPKICHNKSGEINPTKIQKLVEAYVRKIRHNKKVTSSSSVNIQKV